MTLFQEGILMMKKINKCSKVIQFLRLCPKEMDGYLHKDMNQHVHTGSAYKIKRNRSYL